MHETLAEYVDRMNEAAARAHARETRFIIAYTIATAIILPASVLLLYIVKVGNY